MLPSFSLLRQMQPLVQLCSPAGVVTALIGMASQCFGHPRRSPHALGSPAWHAWQRPNATKTVNLDI